jgi:hypothetical protein
MTNLREKQQQQQVKTQVLLYEHHRGNHKRLNEHI